MWVVTGLVTHSRRLWDSDFWSSQAGWASKQTSHSTIGNLLFLISDLYKLVQPTQYSDEQFCHRDFALSDFLLSQVVWSPWELALLSRWNIGNLLLLVSSPHQFSRIFFSLEFVNSAWFSDGGTLPFPASGLNVYQSLSL